MAIVDTLPAAVQEAAAASAPAAPTSDKAGIAHPKKKQVKKPSNARSVATHPTYLEMIREAITSLKERSGSSQFAIAKFIDNKHKDHLPANFNKHLLIRLRKLSANGKLTKVKNSYKLPATTKKPLPSILAKGSKPANSRLKPSFAAIAKPKAKQTVKAKAESVKVPKPKKKVLPVAKPKPLVKAAKLKPKTVANLLSRPSKAAKKSANEAPAKNRAVAKKPVIVQNLAKKVKIVKDVTKSPVKKTRASKAK